jgi:uncharacterized membrane protein
MKKIKISKWSLVFIAVACIASYLLHYFSGMPLWGAAIIVALALVGNGLLAEWEDNRPGGFNNPNPEPGEKDI